MSKEETSPDREEEGSDPSDIDDAAIPLEAVDDPAKDHNQHREKEACAKDSE